MILEIGDRFVVTRDFKIYSLDSLGFYSLLGTPGSQNSVSNQNGKYDRSHEGRIYEVVAMAGPVVAVKILAGGSSYFPDGSVIQINTKEVEIWPAGKDFCDAILNSKN